MNFSDLRVGIGHDTHRLIPGGPLILGGVTVPYTHSLDGHSDADVLLHAVTDAILGAAGLGDIGDWFPNGAIENSGRRSSEMLAIAHQHVQEAGFAIVNLDCIIFAQAPRLAQVKPEISRSIAAVLQLDPGRVGVKAKTGEHVGPVGRGEAMQAQCVALLVGKSTE